MKSSAARKDNEGGAERGGAGGVSAPIHAERYRTSFEKVGKSIGT